MFRESITYARRGTDATKTILTGSLLALAALLLVTLGWLAWLVVVPVTLLAGYATRVAEDALYDDDGAPEFRGWASMGWEGTKTLSIVFVYAALPLAVLALAWSRTPSLTGGLGLVGLAAAVLVALPCWYVGAAGFVYFVRMGRTRDAFRVGRFAPVVTSRAFARSWLASVMLVAASVLVGVALVAVLPYSVATVPTAVAAFYALVASTHLYGRGFATAWAIEQAARTASEDAESRGADLVA